MATYALERLAALLSLSPLPARVRISVFERCGRFGAGATHSDMQPATSYMNRIAGQIALGADESNVSASKLLPRQDRPTFLEWCRTKHAETGNPALRLGPRDIPKRYVHGLALSDMFRRYAALLTAVEGVSLDLYACEVTDVSRDAAGRYLVIADGTAPLRTDQILFVTGHSTNKPAPRSTASALAEHARATPGARYIHYAYPLEDRLAADAVPSSSVVAVLGLGLTAIDIFLHLTEGRGGSFRPIPSSDPVQKFEYIPSGREPALILGISPSGQPVRGRPVNAKEGKAAREHRGVFFTRDAIRSMRTRFGRPVTMPDGLLQHQLDFDRHAFPLVVLEMAFVYYATLLGERFGQYVHRRAAPSYQRFLRDGAATRDDAIATLLAPVDQCFDEAAAYLSGALADEETNTFGRMGVLSSFRKTLGLEPAGEAWRKDAASPWRHPLDARAHRFDWRAIHEPGPANVQTDWRTHAIAAIDRDNLDAAQNNLDNPVKAACDGVWRDLRAVFSELVDHGGLLAESHRRFVSVYLRYYNRLSNGAGLEAMTKIRALIQHGILDVSVGPSPCLSLASGPRPFEIKGSQTGITHHANIIIEGKLHAFDPELDTAPLYPNLLRRGLVRKWRNPGGSPADDFIPGGLDLSTRFHPLQGDGTEDPHLTFLGVPAEGVTTFQASAARPYSSSYVLNTVAAWADEVLQHLAEPPHAPLTSFRSGQSASL